MRRLIDGHYHLARTVKPTSYENLADVLAYLREGGLEAVCVHNIVKWETKNLMRNPLSVLAKLEEPDRIYSFAGIRCPDPEKQWEPWSYREQAEQLMDMGFDGIKILNKPLYKKEWRIPYDHENFDEVWDYLEQEQIPVMFHVGDPKEFWDLGRIPKMMYDFGWYYGKEMPGYESFYEETEGVLRKFPKLNITLPHFYFLSDNLKRLMKFMERYPNVKLDITPGSEMYFNFSICQDMARKFFLTYGDRILFGTDNYGGNDDSTGEEQRRLGMKKIHEMMEFLEQEQCVFQGNRLNGLCLPEDVLERICYGNFRSWAGEKPRRIRTDKAERMILEYRELAEKRPDSGTVLPELDKVLDHLSQYRKNLG